MPDDPLRVRCHVLDTGYCTASEHHLIRGGRRLTIRIHAVVALLHHPRHGWFLFDAGYAPRLIDATARLPFRLYRWATPMHLAPELSAVAQLQRFGIGPDDVKTVLLSHFHADHVAGVRDFPSARFVTTRTAYDDVKERCGWRALRRGFVPSLLPDDFSEGVVLLDRFTGGDLDGLGPIHDLWGDGSVRLVELPGHARGQFGMLVEAEQGPLFFVADGCWLSRNYRENLPPHWLTHFLVDDKHAVRDTVARLHHFAKRNPGVTLIPTHCPETFRQFVGQES